MRRWLCILLLFVVPLHYGWAAAMQSCRDHVRDAQVHDVADDGHRHRHDASVAGAESGETGAVSDHVGDCCDCLAHCAAALPPGCRVQAPDTVDHATPWAAPLAPSFSPSPPERPQWPRLA